MIYEKIALSETDDSVYLDCYVADQVEDVVRDALLVIPGGGYGWICSEREGEPVALSFFAKGMNAFVLHYSVGSGAKFPAPLIQASLAVKHIKDNADRFHIDPNRVFACGFSAGGHLCASLGTLWHLPAIYDAVPMPFGYNKIKGMLPIYPVISALVPGAHLPSFYNLLGTQTPTQQQLREYSLETRVDERTVPAFLLHTAEDGVVSVANTLSFAQALADHSIPFEVHIYPKGAHGVALANKKLTGGNGAGYDNPSIAKWVDHAMEWMAGLE